MLFRQRDLLLVTIPFSDLSSRKIRPVIVLSNDEYNRNGPDLLVAGVTSHVSARPYTVPLDTPQLEDGILHHPSLVRVDKLFSIDQGIIRGRFGRVRGEVLGQIRAQLESLLAERDA